jgi:hypothetical protein
VLRQDFRDRRCQRGLAVVNVTNRPYVAVRLGSVKFLFRHILYSSGAKAPNDFNLFAARLKPRPDTKPSQATLRTIAVGSRPESAINNIDTAS